MELTSELIYGFAGSVLSSRFDEPAPTPQCHKEWWDLCCSKHQFVAIAAPRGHAKSTAITKCYVLAALLFRFRDYCIIISDTFSQATQFIQEIKRELTTNEDLMSLFRIKELVTDREDDLVCEFENGDQFRVRGLGTEQKIRGLLWDNKRPNLIVGDDLENDEIVLNPERREKARNWILNAVIPSMAEKGLMRIVGTVLHMDSLLERFLPKDKDPRTIWSDLCTKTSEPVDGWMSARYWAHNEDYSKTLWPIKWTKRRLLKIRNMFEGQGNPEGYFQEYLNRPIDPKHAFFRKDDFIDFDPTDYERSWDYCPSYCSVDLAVSTTTKRDYCVFGIGSTDETGLLYMRHIIRERQDSKEIVDTIVRLQQRYKFNILLLGKGTLEKGIGPFLREELNRRNVWLHVEAIPEVVDKRLRAQSIRGRMRTGGVKFNKKGFWYLDFEQEMLEFDRGAHDDQVDMMSLFGMYLDNLQVAPSKKEIEDEMWEDENFRSVQFDMNQGKSPDCGY